MTPIEVASFWSKVNAMSGDSACWIWTGTLRNGYGAVKIDNKTYAAHRVSYLLIHGELPPVVRHSCDISERVSPYHLLPGTQRDNIRDMDQRGRRTTKGRPGMSHHEAQLSDDDVRCIRSEAEAGKPQRLIANKFLITQGHVSDIVNRKKWKALA